MWHVPDHLIQIVQFFFQALWFGGDVARIVGNCACPRGMVFDEREMQCQVRLIQQKIFWIRELR